MSQRKQFEKDIAKGYKFEGKQFVLGGAMIDGECISGLHVNLPLQTLNRHGLIAGATGTGKTKTLQIIAEQLSAKGIPVLLMDVKGDLSGIAAPSDGHPKIDERHELIGLPFTPDISPVELLSISEEPGARLRSTVIEFGPVLFSKILGLNDTQSSIIAVVFKFCDDNHLALLDLKDIKKALQFVTGEGKALFQEEYGSISTRSVGTIVRKIVELEQQGAESFFGELSFDVFDLVRKDDHGRGIVSILRLTDIQNRPKLFSTFMLQLLAEIYERFPEEGDADVPKLVLFIDEAHLIFDEASKALLNQIEMIIKLIRSKGIGIFFITQNPADIPDSVLGQLGLKVQHALRAFTAKDRKAIRLAAQNYPETPYYKVDKLLTELGIGEALVSVLNDDGIPTPLVQTMLRAPQSRMDILSQKEIDAVLKYSDLNDKYNKEIDRESAYEILEERIDKALEQKAREKNKKRSRGRGRSGRNKTIVGEMIDSRVGRQFVRTAGREIIRGLFGILKGR